jgi:hypothetical protein
MLSFKQEGKFIGAALGSDNVTGWEDNSEVHTLEFLQPKFNLLTTLSTINIFKLQTRRVPYEEE